MKSLFLILLLAQGSSLFGQVKDTTILIKTPNSQLHIACEKQTLTSDTWGSILFQVLISMNEKGISEADSTGVFAGSFSVKLVYKENCDLERLETVALSKNNSFNAQMIDYFDEFVTAYNSNNLKQFFKQSAFDCGSQTMAFQFNVK